MSSNANELSATLLDVLTQNLGAPVGIYGRDMVFVYANKALADWFGLKPEQIVGKTVRDLYGSEALDKYINLIMRAMEGESFTYERQINNRRGKLGWSTVSLMPWRGKSGEVLGVVFSTMNVDELKTAMDALRMANQRLTSHMENSPLGVLEFDAELCLTSWSPRAAAMFGWTFDEPGQLSAERVFGEDAAADSDLRLAFSLLQRGESTSNRVEAQHLRPDGSVLYCEWFNSALTDANGKVSSIMSQVQDVSSKAQAAAQLRYIAEHDSLTGLPNRASVHQRVDSALKRARRTRELVALLFIDLDGFKAVNDTHGHGAGDEVLKDVAHRIGTCVRATDTVARLGGDEFVVLLEGNVDADTPEAVSQRILAAVKQPFFFSAGYASSAVSVAGEARLGASIGIATQPPLESHVDSLFKRADSAMYAAKRSGKGCVRVAGLEA